jgi:hypothetical protein
MPKTSNFDMGVFKHFPVGDRITTEFRAEAFNVFNHTQFTGINGSPSCFGPNGSFGFNAGNDACVNGDTANGQAASSFLHPNNVHDPRIVQFALKLLF